VSQVRARALLPAVGLACLALAVYAPNLGDDFLGDDFDLIRSFHGQPAGYFVRLLAANASGDVWNAWGLDAAQGRGFLRPLPIWLLKLDSVLWGAEPAGFRLTASLAFVGLVLAVYGLLRALGAALDAAFLGAWLAAVHPVFAQIVPFVAAREETVVSALYLTAFAFFLRMRLRGGSPAPVFACFGLALLTKETAVSWIALALAYDIVTGAVWAPARRRALVGFYSALAAILAAYLGLRWLAFGNIVGGDGKPTSYASTEAFLAYHARFWRGLFEPGLFTDHGFAASPWLLGLGCAALLGVAFRRAGDASWPRRALFFGPCWYLATTALFHGIYYDDRHHALPIVGIALLLALAVDAVGRTLTPAGRAGVVGLGVVASTIFLLPATLRGAAEFGDASRVTARARAHIEALTAGLPDGSAVLLVGTPIEEVPPFYFGWGLQSALKPPFTPSDVSTRLRIVDRKDVALNRYPTRIPRRFDLEIRFAPDGSVIGVSK